MNLNPVAKMREQAGIGLLSTERERLDHLGCWYQGGSFQCDFDTRLCPSS